jgi:hypothetical protein
MKKVNRTYRTNPSKFGKDLTNKIVTDAEEQMEEWEAKGRLPRWMAVKNRLSGKKVTLRKDRG